MRSGAFAPDFPVVNLVVACGDCLRFPSGASDAPLTPRPRHARLRRLDLDGRWGGRGSLGSCHQRGWGGVACGARPRPAARAAFGGLRGVLRRGDDAARLMGIRHGVRRRAASSPRSTTPICQIRPPARPILASLQNPSLYPPRGEKRQAHRPPQRPPRFNHRSLARRRRGGAGRQMRPRETEGSRRRRQRG
ncbi:hypothetical protein D3C86_1608620 [compost metagenome]